MNEYSKDQLISFITKKDNAIKNLKDKCKSLEKKIDQLKLDVEKEKRRLCDIEKRFLEIKIVKSSNSKITINPCSGRVTLKISNKCSEIVRKELKLFAKEIMKENDFVPFTYRGRIKFNKDEKQYVVFLYFDNKMFGKKCVMKIKRDDEDEKSF